MRLFSRIRIASEQLYRLHVRRDPFLREVRRWFKDKGDETLRLDYPLTADSLVIDVGGYRGDFANSIHKRYGCRVIIFEPVSEFYSGCAARFCGNPKISVLNWGLGQSDEIMPIGVNGDGSSFEKEASSEKHELGRLKRADTALSELGVAFIDLMKINIEGGEYALLRTLIDSDWIRQVRFLQVQFHNFVPDAVERHKALRTELHNTHRQMWSYEFVWESWALDEKERADTPTVG